MSGISRMRRFFQIYKEYGLKCCIPVWLSNAFPYKSKENDFRWKLLQKKHDSIIKYLSKNYYRESDSDISQKQTLIHTGCIWTAWLQGEENAPEVIRLTLSSIRKHAGGHDVIVLDENNIKEYIELPEMILKKYRDGIIGKAHFSDIVRMLVLKTYGGLWLDATMLLHEPMCKSAFTESFFSLSSFGFQIHKTRFISGYKWILGIIGGCQCSKYLSQISDMLIEFWLDHNVCIDYFVSDYIIETLYRNNKEFEIQIDSLPHMSFSISKLKEVINKPYSDRLVAEYMIPNQIYYLTYRGTYEKLTQNNEQTIFGFFCEELLENSNEGELHQ